MSGKTVWTKDDAGLKIEEVLILLNPGFVHYASFSKYTLSPSCNPTLFIFL